MLNRLLNSLLVALAASVAVLVTFISAALAVAMFWWVSGGSVWTAGGYLAFFALFFLSGTFAFRTARKRGADARRRRREAE